MIWTRKQTQSQWLSLTYAFNEHGYWPHFTRQTYRRIRCADRIKSVINGCLLIFNRLYQVLRILIDLLLRFTSLFNAQTLATTGESRFSATAHSLRILSNAFWIALMHEEFHTNRLVSLLLIIRLNLSASITNPNTVKFDMMQFVVINFHTLSTVCYFVNCLPCTDFRMNLATPTNEQITVCQFISVDVHICEINTTVAAPYLSDCLVWCLQ